MKSKNKKPSARKVREAQQVREPSPAEKQVNERVSKALMDVKFLAMVKAVVGEEFFKPSTMKNWNKPEKKKPFPHGLYEGFFLAEFLAGRTLSSVEDLREAPEQLRLLYPEDLRRSKLYADRMWNVLSLGTCPTDAGRLVCQVWRLWEGVRTLAEPQEVYLRHSCGIDLKGHPNPPQPIPGKEYLKDDPTGFIRFGMLPGNLADAPSLRSGAKVSKAGGKRTKSNAAVSPEEVPTEPLRFKVHANQTGALDFAVGMDNPHFLAKDPSQAGVDVGYQYTYPWVLAANPVDHEFFGTKSSICCSEVNFVLSLHRQCVYIRPDWPYLPVHDFTPTTHQNALEYFRDFIQAGRGGASQEDALFKSEMNAPWVRHHDPARKVYKREELNLPGCFNGIAEELFAKERTVFRAVLEHPSPHKSLGVSWQAVDPALSRSPLERHLPLSL